MGTDIYISLGSIKRNSKTETLSEHTDTDSSIVLFLNDNNVGFGDIRIEYFDADTDDVNHPRRDYDLFSFLADARTGTEGVKPMLDVQELRKNTRKFLDWLYREKLKTLDGDELSKSDFYWNLGLQDYGYVFYAVSVLTGFNYDQVALVKDRIVNTDPSYIPHPEGKTYRQIFDKRWFEFLNMLVRDDWDFVIFSFDN